MADTAVTPRTGTPRVPGADATLDSISSVRLGFLLQELYDKLSLLEAIAPTERRVGEMERGGDEVAGMLADQRLLQTRYEHLVQSRSQIKAAGNKGKLKDVQAQIEETATQLRFATKKLVRQLQDSPHQSDDVAKTHRQVEQLCRFLETLQAEVSGQGAFHGLAEALERDAQRDEGTKSTQLLEKESGAKMAALHAELAELKESAKRNARSQTEMIEGLREELSESRAEALLSGKFDEAEQSATLEAENRVEIQKAHRENSEIEDLVARSERERQAHEAMADFLERKHRELQRLTEQWDTRYETDIENIELELENLRTQKADGIMKLTEARQAHAELKATVERDFRLHEAQEYARGRHAELLAAVKVITEQWILYKKRKMARRKLRTLRKEAAAAAKNRR
jgi:dynein regulatory complex subunit 9